MESLLHKSIPSTSLRQAINNKCRDCSYDRFAAGNWRQQVTACTSPACPLYLVRPVSKGARKATEIELSAILEARA